MKHVIIGNGIAGTAAAEAIRSVDSNASIVLIAKEPYPPYSRPMISMVLAKQVGFENLAIRKNNYYQDLKADFLSRREVVFLDTDKKQVITDQGEKITFDKLLIATGANPRPMDVLGEKLKNIFYLRNQDHVKKILEAIPKAKQALVLGGGLVGFKAAYGLMRQGLKVKMLITSDYPLSMQLDSVAGKTVLETLLIHGLEVEVGLSVKAFEGQNGRVNKALLVDGTTLDCDLVIIGKGVKPALNFLDKEKIKTDLGILVNSQLQTSEPQIYAAGDVAQTMDLVRDQSWVNAIWPCAVEQGRLAGLNMAGGKVSYQGSLGRNVMRIFELDVMTAGLVNPTAQNDLQILSHLDPKTNSYRNLIIKGNRLVGMALIGNIEQGGILLNFIKNKTPLNFDPSLILDPKFNLSELVAVKTRPPYRY